MSVHLNLGNLLLTVLNIDQTRVSTVVESPNFIAHIETKQVGRAVSGER
jgi:hypothetical protein